jgi:hypothetical protein
MQRNEGVSNAVEESRWQKAEFKSTTWSLPEIVAWPDELVPFSNNDPGRFVVKAEMSLYGERDLDCSVRVGWPSMRDRNDGYDRLAFLAPLDTKNNDRWPLLATLLLPDPVLVMPKIGIVDHKARLGRRDGHEGRYLAFSSLSRCLWRGCMRDFATARTFSSLSSTVAKLWRAAFMRS